MGLKPEFLIGGILVANTKYFFVSVCICLTSPCKRYWLAPDVSYVNPDIIGLY